MFGVCLAILRQASLFLLQSPPFWLEFRLFLLDKIAASLSHCCFVFLDDGISGQPERVSASAASLLHQKDLRLGGLKPNIEKSMLEPSRSMAGLCD